MGRDAWTIFTPYSGLHAVTVVACGVAVVILAALGRRLRKRPGAAGEAMLRKALAAFTISFWVFYNIWWNWTALDVYGGLPLHVCDINGLMAPLVLLAPNRWLRATLYFWTTTLTIQAFIQPNLTSGPALLHFWVFWISHTTILACAAYDIAVRGFRPDWSDFARASAVSIGYLAVIIPIDLALQANYGFVGNPPPDRALPPMVAALGSWPGRVVIMVALAAVGFAVALLPWRLQGARRRFEQDAPA